MTGPTTRLSALDLLFDDPSRAAADIERAIEEHRLLETMPEHAPKLQGAAARFMMGAVVDAIESVLGQLGVAGMLTGGWSQLTDIEHARSQTRADHRSRHITLVRQEITSVHEPRIELVVNDVPMTIMHLLFEAKFEIDTCDLVVGDGELRTAVPGPISVAAALKSGVIPVLSHHIEVDPNRLGPELADLTAQVA